MRMTKTVILCAVAALAMPGQAIAKDDNAQHGDKAAPAIPNPPAGMGQVVFYRSSIMGALISCKVHEGGKIVNHLPPRKYFVMQATPGIHEFTVKSEAKDVIRLEVEDGETQYVRCSIGMGIGVGRPNLSPQNREDFEKHGKGLELVPPYQEKPGHGDQGDRH